jgi:flagellar biosynthetic protein FliR
LLQELLPGGVFAFMLVFARIGSAMMLMPGFGEAFVSPRVRLGMALVVSFAMAPLVIGGLPPLPDGPFAALLIIGTEIGVGLFLGGAARLILASLHVAGTTIAFQAGLGFAQVFDPGQGVQGVLVATFLTLLGVTLVFATDMHLMLLRATFDSYTLFPAAALPPFADFAQLATDSVASSFKLGVQLAAPFVFYGLAFNIGLGLVARLMPALPVFFIAVPAQIMMAFALLALTLSVASISFLNAFEEGMSPFLATRH